MSNYQANSFHIPELLAKLAVGKLTEEETEALDKWRRRSADHQAVYDKWSVGDLLGQEYRRYKEYDYRKAEAYMRQLMTSTPSAVKKRLYSRIRITVAGAVAAAVVLLVLWGNFFNGERDTAIALLSYELPTIRIDDGEGFAVRDASVSMKNGEIIIENSDGTQRIIDPEAICVEERQPMVTLTVPRGHTMEITLEDGTHVWLNAGSELKYPVKFGSDKREVSLSGEGYFNVANDASRSFGVGVQGQALKVLGTQFNISAYDDESHIVTTIVSGTVMVTTVNGEEATLTRNRQSLVDTVTGSLSIEVDVDVSQFTDWRDGNIVIENLTFEQLLTRLSRTYNIWFVTNSDEYNSIVFQGRIPRYDDPKQTLELIEKMSGIKFRVRNGIIHIS